MQVSLQIRNMAEVQQLADKLSRGELKKALSLALNDTGYTVQKAMRTALAGAFDRPTTYITKSPWVKLAKPGELSVSVAPTYMGGKGIDPQKVLQVQEFGGRRKDKRFEVALRRVGILPRGYVTATPKVPYPGSDDGHGSLKGSFVVQLLSYFQAFGEQGYKANMTGKRQRSLQKGTKKQVGRRYFVSYGPLRDGRGVHLQPGIWAASGTHGVDLRPVVMFVRTPSYTPRIDMQDIADKADAQAYLDKRVRFRVREAAGV